MVSERSRLQRKQARRLVARQNRWNGPIRLGSLFSYRLRERVRSGSPGANRRGAAVFRGENAAATFRRGRSGPVRRRKLENREKLAGYRAAGHRPADPQPAREGCSRWAAQHRLFAGPARGQQRLNDRRVAPAIAVRPGGAPITARLGSGAILSFSQTPPPFQLGQHRFAEKLVVVTHARQLGSEM